MQKEDALSPQGKKEFGPGLDNRRPVHLNDIKFVEVSVKGTSEISSLKFPEQHKSGKLEIQTPENVSSKNSGAVVVQTSQAVAGDSSEIESDRNNEHFNKLVIQ